MRKIIVLAVVVFFGFLIANKAVLHANAGEPGHVSCTAMAEQARVDSIHKGYSVAGSLSQAENVLSRCLINGR